MIAEAAVLSTELLFFVTNFLELPKGKLDTTFVQSQIMLDHLKCAAKEKNQCARVFLVLYYNWC